MRLLMLIWVLAAGLAAASAAETGRFVLVRDGKPAATIVLAGQPTRAAEFAAGELQEHVRKITGAVLPIATDGEKVAGPRILIGESDATRKLGLRSRDFRTQEYLIRFLPDTVILMGRDKGRSASGEEPGPKWVAGKFGKALSFDGVDDAFTVADCRFTDEVGSLECWAYLPAKPQPAESTILRLDGSNPWTYHIIRRWPNSSALGYTIYDGQTGSSVSSKELTEGWHHILATHDITAGKMELFVDGVSQGTAKYLLTTCQGAVLNIGGIGGTTVGNPFAGLIDEVRISSVVRKPEVDAAGGPYGTDVSTALLLHFDEGHGAPRDSSGHPQPLGQPPDWFDEKGSLDATYDFLERFCGVRWYVPGDLGTCYSPTKTLAVAGRDIRRAPSMIHRWITPTAFYMPTAADRLSNTDVVLWKLRMRIGGQAFWVCHSFYGYYDRFLKDHPDWFAQGYEGQPPQMCYTDPEFIRQVIQDANDYFDGKGAQPGATALGDVFGLVPMDNMSWCKCPRCQAELNQAEMTNPQFSNGKASNYIFSFANQVAREVRKAHPDKWIGALAYSDYAYHPDIPVEPNVVVQMCLHTRNWWCPSMERNDLKVLNGWVRTERNPPLYLWLYYCFPALQAKYDGYRVFPSYFAHTAVRQMKLYHEAGIRGIFMEHSSECDQTHLIDVPDMYVTLKLADDPTLSGNALIDEFFRRFYGAAARPMRELYLKMEDTYSNPKSYPVEIQKSPAHQHQTEQLVYGSLLTDQRMAQFGRLVAQAQNAAKTDLEKQRVELFREGIYDYLVQGRKQHEERLQTRAGAPPRITVPKVEAADGDLGRVDWSKAAPLGGWRTCQGDQTDRRVEGRVAHDGRYLYVELSEQLDATRLVSTGAIWDGDDWEVFFARERNASSRQIGVAPNGKHFALRHGEEGGAWTDGVQVASDTSGGDHWTVRFAFPVGTLLPRGVEPRTTFYANFYRASPGAGNLLAWSPNLKASFQDTSRLGELTLE